MTDVLADLVACDRYRGLFPAGMPRRACLRRQLEQQREGKAWVPRRPFCAAECPLGREVRAAVEGVALGTCTRCGAALVGETVCEPCASTGLAMAAPRVYGEPCPGCGSVSQHKANCPRPPRPARGGRARRRDGTTHVAPARHVPLVGAPLLSTRIWGPDAPDAPIAPPPRQDVGLTAGQVAESAARVREALKHPGERERASGASRSAGNTAESRGNAGERDPDRASSGAPPTETVVPQQKPHAMRAEPPAQPAEEKTMPTGIRSTPCPGCGTTGSKHCAVNGKDCPERAKAKGPAKVKAAVAAPAKRTAPHRNLLGMLPEEAALVRGSLRRPAPAPTSAHILPVGQLSDEDLAKTIARARAELERRQGEAEQRAKKLAGVIASISEKAA